MIKIIDESKATKKKTKNQKNKIKLKWTMREILWDIFDLVLLFYF